MMLVEVTPTSGRPLLKFTWKYRAIYTWQKRTLTQRRTKPFKAETRAKRMPHLCFLPSYPLARNILNSYMNCIGRVSFKDTLGSEELPKQTAVFVVGSHHI
ncbi:hypothetical protein RRG08_002421 [Elysia crispata]|uniref:Uncharacterized protein n=1 Tax=Elysia crispata TaxID=231223 RepID=A0AAE0ZFW2_9GAST|nr:hypothetical protein RRG08_002421 [Elysia crispata]